MDAFELAGFTAPGENVAGDIFDYALTDTTASLAIFDGTGPGPRAGSGLGGRRGGVPQRTPERR